MATDFHGENQIFGENTVQISRELDLRPKHFFQVLSDEI